MACASELIKYLQYNRFADQFEVTTSRHMLYRLLCGDSFFNNYSIHQYTFPDTKRVIGKAAGSSVIHLSILDLRK